VPKKGESSVKKLPALLLLLLLLFLYACDTAPHQEATSGTAAQAPDTAERRQMQAGSPVILPFVRLEAEPPGWCAGLPGVHDIGGGMQLLTMRVSIQNTGKIPYSLGFGRVSVTFLLNGMYHFGAVVQTTDESGAAVQEYAPGQGGFLLFYAQIPDEIREESAFYRVTLCFDTEFRDTGCAAPEYIYEMSGLF